MNAEIRSIGARETFASVNKQQIAEHITSLMVMYGIEAISTQRYECGYGSRLHVMMSVFDSVPQRMSNQAIVVKDAIGQMMSSCNIQGIVAKPTKKEMKDMVDGWNASLKAADLANEGSGKDEAGAKK